MESLTVHTIEGPLPPKKIFYHLTYTGYYAGRPLCGCDKAVETEMGARFVHAGYHGKMNPELTWLCPDCVAIWDDAINTPDESL